MRNALVVSEIAFACVLLVGAGLLIRSLVRVLDVDMGFQPARAATIRVDPDSRYTTREQRTAYFDEVLRRVKEMPGVEGAGITDALPLGRNRTWGARRKGVTYERGKPPSAFVRIVSDGYPAAMGIPLRRRPRLRRERHARTSEPVIVINETHGATRSGRARIRSASTCSGACAKERRVVGVVGDVRHLALEQGSGNEMYIPAAPVRRSAVGAISSCARRCRRRSSPARCARRLQPLAANLAGNDFRTLQQIVDKSVSPRRFTGAAARRLRRVRAGARLARHLRADLVLGQPAHAGDRHPHGARRLGARRAARIIAQTLRLAAIGMVIGAAARGCWRAARRACSSA